MTVPGSGEGGDVHPHSDWPGSASKSVGSAAHCARSADRIVDSARSADRIVDSAAFLPLCMMGGRPQKLRIYSIRLRVTTDRPAADVLCSFLGLRNRHEGFDEAVCRESDGLDSGPSRGTPRNADDSTVCTGIFHLGEHRSCPCAMRPCHWPTTPTGRRILRRLRRHWQKNRSCKFIANPVPCATGALAMPMARPTAPIGGVCPTAAEPT